jgi:hypothetical protein
MEMPRDWSLLFWVWVCGTGCGALLGHAVLKLFDSNNRAGYRHGERQKPPPFL